MGDTTAMLHDPQDPRIAVPARPAPWSLRGRGYILVYKLPRDLLLERGFIPDWAREDFVGGLSALMLVDYETSDAGPYSELLFIPGKFRLRGGKWNRITRIYVSTMDSVLNGRANWDIPKEEASFAFAPRAGAEEVTVGRGGATYFSASLSAGGPAFPVSTALLPFPLLQGKPGAWLQTTFSGRGRGRLATVRSLSADPAFFPDLGDRKPLGAIAVDPFAITFPVAKEYRD